MHIKLHEALASLARNIEVLNEEVERLARCDQFAYDVQSWQLIERIRGGCSTSLLVLQSVERRLRVAEREIKKH